MAEHSGRVALVSGGAGGIGAAVARAFHAAGAAVAIADTNAGGGAALAAELGERALFVATDVGDDDQIAACVEAVVAQFGGIDVLVNSAVLFADGGLFESSRADWLAALGINVVGAAMLFRAAAPHLKARRGAVVNFGSIAGKFGQRGRAIYPVCKAAIQQLTRNQAMEMAPYGVRVNAVSPGWTWSPAIAGPAGGDRAKADRIAGELHPLGRVGNAEEVAAAVLFLCSDAASFTTGADLPVDGGYHMTGPDCGTPQQPRLAG